MSPTPHLSIIMKNILLVLIVIILSVSAPLSQTVKRMSLLVSNYEESESLGVTNHLFAYHFDDGKFAGKELIVTSKTADVNFGHGGNRIYQNRYAITRWGDIIDVKKKKILHVSDGDLLRLEGSRVYIQVNKNDDNALYYYDLESGKYIRVRKTDTGMFFGVLSPNGTRSLINLSLNLEVCEYAKGCEPIRGTFAVKAEPDVSSSEMLRTPVYWLSDEVLLTQRTNGELVTVNVVTQHISPFLTIPTEGLSKGNPLLYLDDDGNLLYRCGKTYRIDIEKRSYSIWTGNLKNDFTVKYSAGADRQFMFRAADIGKVWSTGSKTATGHIAVLYGEQGSNLGYPDGVQVWNNITREWIPIKIKWGADLIGWVAENK